MSRSPRSRRPFHLWMTRIEHGLGQIAIIVGIECLNHRFVVNREGGGSRLAMEDSTCYDTLGVFCCGSHSGRRFRGRKLRECRSEGDKGEFAVQPLISCLMVTQPGREAFARTAFACFQIETRLESYKLERPVTVCGHDGAAFTV